MDKNIKTAVNPLDEKTKSKLRSRMSEDGYKEGIINRTLISIENCEDVVREAIISYADNGDEKNIDVDVQFSKYVYEDGDEKVTETYRISYKEVRDMFPKFNKIAAYLLLDLALKNPDAFNYYILVNFVKIENADAIEGQIVSKENEEPDNEAAANEEPDNEAAVNKTVIGVPLKDKLLHKVKLLNAEKSIDLYIHTFTNMTDKCQKALDDFLNDKDSVDLDYKNDFEIAPPDMKSLTEKGYSDVEALIFLKAYECTYDYYINGIFDTVRTPEYINYIFNEIEHKEITDDFLSLLGDTALTSVKKYINNKSDDLTFSFKTIKFSDISDAANKDTEDKINAFDIIIIADKLLSLSDKIKDIPNVENTK